MEESKLLAVNLFGVHFIYLGTACTCEIFAKPTFIHHGESSCHMTSRKYCLFYCYVRIWDKIRVGKRRNEMNCF